MAGKVALVTGGHGGIGKVISLGLADAGADVVLASRSLDALKVVVKEVEAKGRKSMTVMVDVTDREQVKGMADRYGILLF